MRNTKRKGKSDAIVHVVHVVMVLFMLMIAGIGLMFDRITSDEYLAVIANKEISMTGSGKSIRPQMLVYTETETFKCTDSWAYMKFDSSDVYGKLAVGQRYKMHVCGWRIPFLSMYRNIIGYKKIPMTITD